MADGKRAGNSTQVQIHYQVEANAPVVYAHGAYGGIGPRGDVIMNIYYDNWPLPAASSLIINEEGRVVSEQTERDESIVRSIVARIIMPPPIARSLAEWLREKAEEAEAKIQEKTGTSSPQENANTQA